VSAELTEPAVVDRRTNEGALTGTAAPPGAGRGRKLVLAGAVLIALALIVRVAIVPSLIKLPTNFDATAAYSGEQIGYVDRATGAPLADPQRAPLTISRHVTADKHASDGDRIVLDEALTARVQGAPAVRQTNRYVMDRQSAVNVADRRSYAFAPTNKVDRSGAYRLAFGFGVPEGQPIKLYSNDTDSTYTAVPDRRQPTVTVQGHRALMYGARQRAHALSPVYLAALKEELGLPTTTTVRALSSTLTRAGVDVSAVVAALPPADRARIAALESKAVPLIYGESVTARFAIEPKTGAVAKLFGQRATVTMRPDPKALAPLVAILKRNAGVAAVRRSLPKLQSAATRAQPVFALDYRQTPASVSDTAGDIGAATLQLSVAKLWLPLLVAAVGLGLIALAARRARRTR
jgi:hypothetical protein